jgi:hypothetical protein
MSFDLGVWYSDVPLTREEAGEFYARLNGNRVFVRRHPQFDAFWSELIARFPDQRSPDDPPADFDELSSNLLQTPAEIKPRPMPDAAAQAAFFEAERNKRPVPEDSPWAATLAPAGSAVALPILGSNVRDVAIDVFIMVRRHGLVIFNPQETWVWYPPKLKRRKPRPAPPLLRLRIAGTTPELAVTIRLDEEVLLQATLPSRREAHAQTRALTIEKGLAFYDVDDPGSLAQSIVWAPMEPGDPNYPPGAMPSVEVSTLTIRDDV